MDFCFLEARWESCILTNDGCKVKLQKPLISFFFFLFLGDSYLE